MTINKEKSIRRKRTDKPNKHRNFNGFIMNYEFLTRNYKVFLNNLDTFFK